MKKSLVVLALALALGTGSAAQAMEQSETPTSAVPRLRQMPVFLIALIFENYTRISCNRKSACQMAGAF